MAKLSAHHISKAAARVQNNMNKFLNVSNEVAKLTLNHYKKLKS
jgi:hypothetical protein